MANRRASRRIPSRNKVKYGLLNSPNSTFTGYTINLSEDGACVKARRIFPPGSKILLQLYLGSSNLGEGSMDEIIRVEGTVVWVSPTLPGIIPTMGIKFSNRNSDLKRIYNTRTISINTM
jgi:hypothetical protein